MDVLMPQLGETVLEGTVALWYKKAGDTVAKGDVLLDVETDKAATEIEAPVDGVISSISVPEGETVDVGTVLAVISVEGEAVAEAPAAKAAAEPAAAAEVTKPAGGGLPPKSAGGKVSPAVRRLLKQHDLDIAEISGSGRDGRVTKEDVLNVVAAKAAPTQGAALTQGAAGESIPFDRFRKITAEHMVRSKATSAHVLQAIDIDFTAVDALRLQKNADVPAFCRACCMPCACGIPES